jgi:hypothetical protein
MKNWIGIKKGPEQTILNDTVQNTVKSALNSQKTAYFHEFIDYNKLVIKGSMRPSLMRKFTQAVAKSSLQETRNGRTGQKVPGKSLQVVHVDRDSRTFERIANRWDTQQPQSRLQFYRLEIQDPKPRVLVYWASG